ncbi:MAG: Holliday junction resolvase [Treponema sp.]|nr:Holliday junction resolvase [Treponema sp.]
MEQLLNKNNLILLLLIILTVFSFVFLIIQKIKFNSMIKKIRADAVKRSKAVIGGQMAEQIAPFLPDFPCNAADVRFVGKPVDFIGFSGLAEADRIDEIVFIEVKTGESKLSEREKEVKRAVQEKRIKYVEYYI